MLYNMTNLTNSSDFAGMIHYLQFDAGLFYLTPLFMLAIFAISFMGLRRYGNLNALYPSLFIVFLSSVFFWLMGLLDIAWVFGSAVALGASFMFSFFYND